LPALEVGSARGGERGCRDVGVAVGSKLGHRGVRVVLSINSVLLRLLGLFLRLFGCAVSLLLIYRRGQTLCGRRRPLFSLVSRSTSFIQRHKGGNLIRVPLPRGPRFRHLNRYVLLLLEQVV